MFLTSLFKQISIKLITVLITETFLQQMYSGSFQILAFLLWVAAAWLQIMSEWASANSQISLDDENLNGLSACRHFKGICRRQPHQDMQDSPPEVEWNWATVGMYRHLSMLGRCLVSCFESRGVLIRISRSGSAHLRPICSISWSGIGRSRSDFLW